MDKSVTILVCWGPGKDNNVSLRRSSFRPVIISLAPAFAHSSAMALPIPDDAPVTRIVLSFSENGFI